MHNMTSDEYAEEVRRRIDDDRTHVTSYYGAASGFQSNHGTAPDGAAVAMTSTINNLYVTEDLFSSYLNPSLKILINHIINIKLHL